MHPLFDQRSFDTRRTHGGPGLNLSVLHQLDRALPVSGFAIKYVVQGIERYTVAGAGYPVSAGHYLLANRCCETRVLIDDALPVKGLCIELTTALLDDVVHGCTRPEDFADAAGTSFFTGPEFLEGMHDARHSTLGPLLHQLAADLFTDPSDARYAGTGLYYALAERVVRDHEAVVPRLRALGAVRATTRKDIYRRVQRAKAFMDADLHRPLSVEAMAREAAMGTYHFFRAFRSIEGMSPHQYRLQRRFQAAHAMLLQGHTSVHDTALLTGFADMPSFSKAFSKHYGHPPSHLLGGSRRI
ncbi:MAG: AraC family transcriptional regulator [Flavobacteriales bacterium]